MKERPTGLRERVSLAPYTTFKIGGLADFFVPVTSVSELAAVLMWAEAESVPVHILGGGSNTVFADAGYPGVVIQIQLKGIESEVSLEEVLLTVAAGEPWDDVVGYTVEQGWWGLENLSSIPGSVGAAPIQNIGAYGVEVSSLITSVQVYDKNKKQVTVLSNEDCQFAYRDSIFKQPAGKQYVVLSVTFSLSKTPKPITHYPDIVKALSESKLPTIHKVRNTVVSIRVAKFPDIAKLGTAGSFFKNPVVSSLEYSQLLQRYPDIPGHASGSGVKVSAAWLIDNVAEARGEVFGNVGSYQNQALVFVNFGNATAKELDQFAHEVANRIYKKSGITLEREVQFIL